jgi:hypothetical protein
MDFGNVDARPQFLDGFRLDRNPRLNDANKRNSSGIQRATAKQKLEL